MDTNNATSGGKPGSSRRFVIIAAVCLSVFMLALYFNQEEEKKRLCKQNQARLTMWLIFNNATEPEEVFLLPGDAVNTAGLIDRKDKKCSYIVANNGVMDKCAVDKHNKL